MKFRAWAISIFVHLIVLAAFGTVKFSKLQVKDKQRTIPLCNVSQIRRLTQAAPTAPKPKIKKLLNSENQKTVVKNTKQLSTTWFFDTSKPGLQDLGNWEKPLVSKNDFSLVSDVISQKSVEFFGSVTYQRKICYVVDCSGSMQGIFGRVQKKLVESLETLQPDQYFYLIFFGDEKLFEFGNGRLIRASPKNKSAACDFIDSIQPAGRTNAMAALEQALQIRDSAGLAPSVIYFLTDGFELAPEDTRKFSQKVTELLGQFAPKTRINTIGFWPQRDDYRMLKEIATISGGEWIFINE